MNLHSMGIFSGLKYFQALETPQLAREITWILLKFIHDDNSFYKFALHAMKGDWYRFSHT